MWPYAVLLGEVLVFYRHVLFTRHYSIPWDFRDYHFPLAWLMGRAFGRGELPLWDPFSYCGMPAYANPQMQLFYPPAALFALIGNLGGGTHALYWLGAHLVAHVLLGGAVAYRLFRRLGLSTAGALTGATAFQLGCYFASQAQHLGAIDGAAWMPLGWLAIVELADRFRWRWLAALALALAMSVLAGFPATALVVWVSCAAFAAVWKLRTLGYVAAAAVWAVLLAAVQLLPARELVGWSVAAGRADVHGAGGVPLEALATLVWPNYWGVLSFDAATWRLPWNPTFLYLYGGLAALVCAAFARRALRFALLAVFFGLWMLGSSTPVGAAVLPLAPAAVRAFHYPEFAMAGFSLSMASLAAYGAHRLLAKRSRRVQSAAVALVAADLVWVSSGRPLNTSDDHLEPGITYRQVDGFREVPAAVRNLLYASHPPARFDVMGGGQHWAGTARATEWPSAAGNDPLAPSRVMDLRRVFCQGGDERFCEIAQPDSPVLKLLNVAYVLSRGPMPHPGKLEHVMDLPGLTVYRNPGALPRFFLVGTTRPAADRGEALALLRSPAFDVRAEAVVEGSEPLRGGGSGTITVVRYGTNGFELQTDTAAPSFLVTSETYYPGWRAAIDGEERAPVMTNAAFRGLPVPAGRRRVRMWFDPAPLRRGAAISLAAAVLAIAAIYNKRTGSPWTSSSN